MRERIRNWETSFLCSISVFDWNFEITHHKGYPIEINHILKDIPLLHRIKYESNNQSIFFNAIFALAKRKQRKKNMKEWFMCIQRNWKFNKYTSFISHMSIEFTIICFNFNVLDYRLECSEWGQYWNEFSNKTLNQTAVCIRHFHHKQVIITRLLCVFAWMELWWTRTKINSIQF